MGPRTWDRKQVIMKETLDRLSSGRQLRIGVVKTDGIGDAVLASPFFYELRKDFKNAHITGFLSPMGNEVLDGLNVFDEVRGIDPKWLKYKKLNIFTRLISAFKLAGMINREKIDLLIGMRYHDRLSSLILSLAKAKLKIGYDVKGMGFGINIKMPLPPKGMHVILKNLSILKYFIPGKKAKIKMGFSTNRQSDKKVEKLLKENKITRYMVVHPVSGHISKDWSILKYKELLKKLSRKYKIIVVGGKDDHRIDEFMGKNIYNFAGDLNIKELGSLIKGAHFVLGNDSAAVHIAAVYGIKSLTIFSGTCLYEEWMAYNRKSYIITKSVDCRECALVKCNKKEHECMDINIEFVEKVIAKILAGKQKHNIINFG